MNKVALDDDIKAEGLSILGDLPVSPSDPVPEGTRSILMLGPDEPNFWKIFKDNKIYASNFQPRNLVGSPLSNFLYEQSNTIPYDDAQSLLELLSDSSILENRFNFIYYPLIDVTAHIFGVNSDEWQIEITKFEKLVNEISNISNKKTKTIISADHGLVNINDEFRHHLNYGDDLQIYGDQRSVYINGPKKNVLETFSKKKIKR